MASPRLYTPLKELALKRAIDAYGIEKIWKLIEEDETARPGDPVTIPGMKAFKPLLVKELQVLVSPIMLVSVQGDLNQAKRLVEAANLSLLSLLLSVKSEAIDYLRRTIKDKTPFQAALCAWDDEMCEMFKEYMSDEEVARQYQEIFPEGHEKYFEAQTPYDFSNIVDAINQSNDVDVEAQLKLQQNDSSLCQLFNRFREDFTLQSQQETVFNPKHLLKAFEIYDEQFDNWNSNKRDLFWRQVIGYVQRFFPANIAQDFAQGLYYRVEEKEKSKRSFTFRFGGGSIYPLSLYPLSFDSLSGLGFEYAARGLAGIGSPEGASWFRTDGTLFYKTYIEQKLQTCKTYAATPNSSDRVCDLMM